MVASMGGANFQPRRRSLQAGEIGACAIRGLACLCQLLDACALLQFAQIRLGAAQRRFRGVGRGHLAIGVGLADQAALHQP